jgi:hypothetical protein
VCQPSSAPGLLMPRMFEWQEVRHVGVRWTLRQLLKYAQPVVVRFDTAGAARQHETVNRGARFCAVDRVAEQPRLSRSGERPDVPLLSGYRNYADFQVPTIFMI